MDEQYWLEKVKYLPPNAQRFLYSEEYAKRINNLIGQFGLEEDFIVRLENVFTRPFFEISKAEEFLPILKKACSNTDLFRSVLLTIIYPLSDIIEWSVVDVLQSEGFTDDDISKIEKISFLPKTSSDITKHLLRKASISVLPSDLFKKFTDSVQAYSAGLITDTNFLELCYRKQVLGGFGFTEDQARVLSSSLKEILSTTKPVSEAEYADYIRKKELGLLTLWKQDLLQDVVEEVDDDNTNPLVIRPLLQGLSSKYEPALEQAIRECLLQIGDLDLDEYISKRLENVISTRLRNVRNSIQTIAILAREQHIGGVGLSQEQADRVAQIIEASYQAHHDAIEQDQRSKIAEIEQVQKQKIEERRKQESQDHAEWYKERLAGSPSTNSQKPQIPASATVPLPKQLLSGITPPMQLSDLIGELKMMDTGAFRRLGRDADEAGDRLFQKFETLRQESFERYTAGIEAWRSSPLQKRYLQLVSESFMKSKTVNEVADEYRAKDPLTPTGEELGAIITLNGKIQY